MAWTQERVQLLESLWKTGLSASGIAEKLGGVSRNAVIGKIHRLGLPGRVAQADRPAAPKQKKRPATRRNVAGGTNTRRAGSARPAAAAPKEPSAAVTWLKVRAADSATQGREAPAPLMVQTAELRESMCKWPIGDPGRPGFGFCGHPRSAGLPYCLAHAATAFQVPQRRSSEFAAKSAPTRRLAG